MVFAFAAGALAVADSAQNFDRDTAPEGYTTASGYVVSQISDGELYPHLLPQSTRTDSPQGQIQAPTSPQTYASASATSAAAVTVSSSTEVAPVYSSATSAAPVETSPVAYTSAVVTSVIPVPSSATAVAPVPVSNATSAAHMGRRRKRQCTYRLQTRRQVSGFPNSFL